MTDKTILVTGASGFVGSHLCRILKQNGYRVRRALRRPAAESSDFDDVITGEIDETTNWNEALQGVDTVVHLAARVHVMNETHSDPLEEFRRINVRGSETLLSQAANATVPHFVYLSSIKVNGEKTVDAPFGHDDEPRPEEPYAISKLEAEQRLRSVARERSVCLSIVRPPLVYGPGERGNFSRLLKLADSSIPLPFSLCDNKRSLIYVENLCDFIVRTIERHPYKSELFTLCDPAPVSTRELLSEIRHALKRPAALFPFPTPVLKTALTLIGKRSVFDRLYDSLEIDATHARTLLDWNAPFTTQEGIRRTVEWYRATKQ